MSDEVSVRRDHFAREHLTWIAVRHFLTSDLLEELSRALVDVITEGRISLDDLFDTTRTSGPAELSSWVARPQETKEAHHTLLQSVIKSLIWTSDYAIWSIPEDAVARETELLNGISKAFSLSSLDFGTVAQFKKFQSVPHALHEFLDAISMLSVASESEGFELVSILARLEARFEAPLNAIAVKHLGDLCADADHWQYATEIYTYAAQILPEAVGPWADLARVLHGVIEQSRGMATWMLEGAGAAFSSYNDLIRYGSLPTNPLPLFNAMTDALNASFSTDGPFIADRRVIRSFAPQLVDTHSLASALSDWKREKHADAHKAFWAVLRRQTALGSISASRWTKALYGECLIDHVRLQQGQHSNHSHFLVGLRLLIESGDAKTADRVAWPEPLVAEYVNADLVATALAHARNAPGVEHERLRVVLTLLKCWVLVLPRDSTALAQAVLEILAQAVTNSDDRGDDERKVAVVALQSLSAVAKSRPEFLPLAARSIADAIIVQIDKAGFLDAGDAIAIAESMVEAFDEGELLALAHATLDRLVTFTPSQSPWPIVRPAIAFLSSPGILALCKDHLALRQKLPNTVITFALETESEYDSLMYMLRDFEPSWIDENAIAPRIGDVVLKLRDRAKNINSSRTSGDITALLVAPAFSGAAGVRDALNALYDIIQTAADGRAALSFDTAWRPLMVAFDTREAIIHETSLRAEDLATYLNSIATALVAIWNNAKAKPLIFAGFAIPKPSAPNATIVHNWAFASVGLGRVLGRESEMAQALQLAAHQPVLKRAITLAQAVRFVAGDPVPLDARSIGDEGKEAFYAALGKRLLLIKELPTAIRAEITFALAAQCLRQGPSGLDAAVFLAAIDQDFDCAPLTTEVRAYRQRLANNSDLRISLAPLLETLEQRVLGIEK